VDTAGNLVERTLDQTGNLVNSRTLGRALDLPVVRETTNAAGQTVRQVRDTGGGLIELTLDRAGQVVNSRVLNGAGGTGSSSTQPPAATVQRPSPVPTVPSR
jgi:hypothetical protein